VPLHKRARVVQERALSPRTLYYGNEIVFWEYIEAKGDPYRVRYDLPKLSLDATDDGGIWVVATCLTQPRSPAWVWENWLALLEAKRAFQSIDVNNQPVVSDANWSQYTCEALTAFLDNLDQDEYVYPSAP
jgi:hypothetical protein